MILFNNKKLAVHLQEGRITQKQQSIYILILLLIYKIQTTNIARYTLFDKHEEGLLIRHIASDLTWITVLFLSLIISYRINKKSDNKDFILRYVCLSIPIYFQVFLLSLILIFIPFILFYILDYIVPIQIYAYLALIIPITFCLFQYYRSFKFLITEKAA